MTDATVVRWIKSVGDDVSTGDPIVEVETDKAVFELESEHQGVLLLQLAKPGDTVPVAFPIAVIGESNEDLTDHLRLIEEAKSKHRPDERHALRSHLDWYSDSQPAASVIGGPSDASQISGRPKATPAARNLARRLGVDLVSLAATLEGRATIEKRDVERASTAIPLAVFGAGLGAAQIIDVTQRSNGYKVVALADDNETLWGSTIRGRPVWGMDELSRAIDEGAVRAVAVSIHSNARKPVYLRLKERFPKIPFPALVHANAYVGEDVVVGEGVLVEPGATVGPGSVLDEGVIVDVGVTVSHHCYIGRFCHLAPGCVVSGNVKIDDNTVVMAGAVINNTSTIGRNVVVTPGSVVAYDVIEDGVILHGNPARVTGKSKRA